jgi:site-specific DNA recombinase
MRQNLNTAQYEKFKSMLTQEKNEKLKFTEKVGFDLSNLEKAVEIVLNKAPKLSSMWENGNLAEKRKIQKMVFPDGIEYDRENDEYRTFRVNSFFSYIPVISKELGYKKTGKFRVKTKNSGSVLEAGLEPARPRGHRILSPACLPIPPLERDFKSKIKPSKHLFRRF